MLQILALIILASVAADISQRVYLSRAVFTQLAQPASVAWMVWLYPVPFLLPLFAKISDSVSGAMRIASNATLESDSAIHRGLCVQNLQCSNGSGATGFNSEFFEDFLHMLLHGGFRNAKNCRNI
jgi:hypothetical protein